MSRSCFASLPVCAHKFSSHYLNNIIFIDNSLGPLARESPCRTADGQLTLRTLYPVVFLWVKTRAKMTIMRILVSASKLSPGTRLALLTDRESSFIELIVTIFCGMRWINGPAGIAQLVQWLGGGLDDRGTVLKSSAAVRDKTAWALSWPFTHVYCQG